MVMPLESKPTYGAGSFNDSSRQNSGVPDAGCLIINADDWGQNHETTDRIFDCAVRGNISSVSAMVFMDDSERAAGLAQESGIDAGIHLNFTTPFSAGSCPPRLLERQREVAAYLLRYPLARVIFHPGLTRSFEYVVAAQIIEFCRLYGVPPARLDGHHHQHLCANVLFGGLLPQGTIARRNFFFWPGEKSSLNRYYRKAIDHLLATHHQIVDFLFVLPPIEPAARLKRIRSLANQFTIELETHPVNPEEYRFLTRGEIRRCFGDIPIAPRFAVPERLAARNRTNH